MSLIGFTKTAPSSLTPSSTVFEACRSMFDRNFGAVAVVDAGKLCGIFTYRDLIERVLLPKRDPERVPLSEVMTKKVETIAVDRSHGDALRLMVEHDYSYLPVVEAEGEPRLLGMLSLRGLLEHEIQHLADELDAVTNYFTSEGIGGD